MKVLHIITGLQYGGAEMMLYKLLACFDPSETSNAVVSLTTEDELGTKIKELGIPVLALEMNPALPNPLAILRLRNIIKNHKPDIIQTWMYHANVLGAISAKLARNSNIIWNVRKGKISNNMKRRTRWVLKASAILSYYLPKAIIMNSHRGIEQHRAYGYAAKKCMMIPNGFNLSVYKPNAHAAIRIKQELGIHPSTPLVGMIARFHPEKDHHTFIKAASILSKSMPSTHFLLAGNRIIWQNEALSRWIKEANLQNHFHLLGLRVDIPEILSALDIGSLSSNSEGFPNIIGETMACGVPFVSTDVGDAASIVGNTGVIVQTENPEQLAEAWETILKMNTPQKKELEKLARQRIKQYYDIVHIASQYQDLYANTLRGKA